MGFKTIIINGCGGSGKDTFVKLCSQYAFTKNFSSVKKVKEAAKLLGWKGDKTEKDRAFLCSLKDLSAKYNDLPFKDMENEVVWSRDYSTVELLFLHIREPEQIARAKEAFNAVTLLIDRPDSPKLFGNHADDDVYNYHYDYCIVNDGTIDNLTKKAHRFVMEMREKGDAV